MNNPLLALLVLAGSKWQDWELMDPDQAWWALRLWTRRN